MTRIDAAQRERTAEFERRVVFSEEQPAVLETASRENESRKRERRECSSKCGSEKSS